jgi:hypothetical protein
LRENESRTTHLLDLERVKLGLLESLLDLADDARVDGGGEEVEAGAVDVAVEVGALSESLDGARGGGGGGEGLLGNLDGEAKLDLSAVVRSLEGDLGLLGELLAEPVHQLLIEEVAAKLAVDDGSEGVEETVTNSDDGGSGGGSSNVEDDDVAVNGEVLGLGDLSRGVGGEGSGGFGDGLKDVDTGLLGGGDDGLSLGVGEVGGDGEDGVGNGATEEVGSVGEKDSEEADGGVVGGEGGGDAVDVDGEGRGAVRVDNGGGVGGLLDVLDLVVAVEENRLGSFFFVQNPRECLPLAEEVAESKDGVLSVANELNASGNTRVLWGGRRK